VNFIDTAELYAVLASKVTGPADGWLPHIRNDPGRRLDKKNIVEALENGAFTSG